MYRPYQSSWQPPSWQMPQQPSVPPPPLGKLIRELTSQDLSNEAEKLRDDASISDVSLISSYNWLRGQKSTILVPGRPPRWTPLAEPKVLRDDNGYIGNKPVAKVTTKYYRDRNAAQYPKHPMEPGIVATLATAPEISSKNIDIVACGSTLGNLLRFVRGDDKTFRMLVEVVGDTVFLIRRENSPTEEFPDIQGYGHSFPEHYTTWDADVKGSSSHQRVLRYRFGRMSFLVRFEADGYIPDLADHSSGSRASATASTSAAGSSSAALDEALESLGGFKLTPAVDSGPANTELQTKAAGELVDQSQVFDIKTRSAKKKLVDTLDQELHRLWIRQLPKFILAYHERGSFTDIRIMDIGDKIKEWEAENTDLLSKLAAVISLIRDTVRARPDSKLELRQSKAGALEVHEQLADAGDALSAAVAAQWTGAATDRGGAEEDTDDEQQVTKKSDEEADDDDDYDYDDWDRFAERSFDYDDDEGTKDFTACSAEHCGYCGRCDYPDPDDGF